MDLVIKNKADKFTDKVIMTDKILSEAQNVVCIFIIGIITSR